MKKITLFFLSLLMSMTIFAQQSDFSKAVARFSNSSSATASVVRTTHRKAIVNDVKANGMLTMKKPSQVSIVMDGGKDQLLMQGSKFTMMVKGKKHETSSQNNPQFASFQAVFESILSGGSKDISKLEDLAITKQGGLIVLTITPKVEGKKAKRMLFSSFVMTIDPKTSELKTLRMNERSGYTEYAFSNFKFK